LGLAADHDLVAAIVRIDRGIEELAVDFSPAQAFPLDEMA
jgi:hypothetical protein